MKCIYFMLALFFSISVNAQDCCEYKLDKRISINQLGQAFQQLRNSKNKDCCDNFGSGLMTVMTILNDSLDLGISESEIMELMGKPDIYASKNHPIEHHFVGLKENERVLIYYWRGMHDFLYLSIKDNILIYKNWYYAGE